MAYPYRKLIKPPLGSRPYKGYRLSRGLVGFWLMNEGSGDKVFDLSGNGNDGTLDTVTWKPGNFGSALDFDGANSLVSCGSNSVLDDLGPVTIVVWIYPRTIGELIGHIYCKGDSYNNYTLFHFATTNTYQFTVDYATTNLVRAASDNSATYNTWQQLAVTWDGTTTAANVHIYKNGIELSYKTTTNAVGDRISDAAYNLNIGNIPAKSRTIDGLIDCMMVYNHALTASEIALLYREPFCMFKDPAEIALLGGYQGGGINYEELNLAVSLTASVVPTDIQQMLDTNKAVEVVGSVTKTDTSAMTDTEKAVTLAASIVPTDSQQMLDTGKALTIAASVSKIDAQQMLETNKAVTFAAGVTIVDTKQMYDTELGVGVALSVTESDNQQMKDLLKVLTFAASVSESDTQQMKDLLLALTFAASVGIGYEHYTPAGAALLAMYAFVVLRQHTS